MAGPITSCGTVLWLCGGRLFGSLTHLAVPWCRAPVNPCCGAALQVFVDEISCIGCGKCVRACPQTFEIEASKYGRARVIAQAVDELEDIQVRAWAEVNAVCCIVCAMCQEHAARGGCTGGGWEPPNLLGQPALKTVIVCRPNFITTLLRERAPVCCPCFPPSSAMQQRPPLLLTCCPPAVPDADCYRVLPRGLHPLGEWRAGNAASCWMRVLRP